MKSSPNQLPIIPLWLRGMRILIVAVILNIVASELGIATWYEFVQNPLASRPIVDLAFLFILYPFALGASAMK